MNPNSRSIPTMILEGIVTSQNAGGEWNLAPMGPIVDESMSTLVLRPFQSSRTYQNLKEHPQGVLHVTDDVLLFAQTVTGQLQDLPECMPAVRVAGSVLKSACRWYEFQVEDIDDSDDRTRIVCHIVYSGRLRDFFGFNRAKHAVLEAAVLATRLHILPAEAIQEQYAALRIPVMKTAGQQERLAFDLLATYVQTQLDGNQTGPAAAVVQDGDSSE